MAITIDATVGGANSNSYLTIARAAVLAETLPHMNEWFTDSSINKAQLLLHGTRLLDRHFLPNGTRVSATQALWWPQSGLYYANTSTAIPTSIIPEFVELATIEWAWALHQTPDAYAEIASGLEELDTPSYRMKFTGAKQQIVPRVVSELLSPYAVRQVQMSHRLVRT